MAGVVDRLILGEQLDRPVDAPDHRCRTPCAVRQAA
jgi:hypothetical protein